MSYGFPPPYLPPAAPQAPYGYGGYPQPGPPMAFAPSFMGPIKFSGGWIKWAYFACITLMGMFMVAGWVFSDQGHGEPWSGDYGNYELSEWGGWMFAFAAMLWCVRLIFGLIWLHSAWSSIPYEYRSISPGQAVGMMFIPIYNLYWVFKANVGLTSALDYALAGSGSMRQASKGAAIFACIMQVIPYANLFLAPFTWVFHMFSVDAARKELCDLLAGSAGAQGPSAPPAPIYGIPMGPTY